MRRHLLQLTLPALLLVFACGGEDSPTAAGSSLTQLPAAQRPRGLPQGVAPDFSLPDVNSTSSRFGEMVSPRDYLQTVSGWYFGHAT